MITFYAFAPLLVIARIIQQFLLIDSKTIGCHSFGETESLVYNITIYQVYKKTLTSMAIL